MKLDEDKQCMTQLKMRSASAFLTNIVEYGYHSWTFKINKCDRGRGSGWSAMIGFWKIDSEIMVKHLIFITVNTKLL